MLFYAEGRTEARTDMTKLIVVFRNFAKAPKNLISLNFSLRWRRRTKLCDRPTSVTIQRSEGAPISRQEQITFLFIHEFSSPLAFLWTAKQRAFESSISYCRITIDNCSQTFLLRTLSPWRSCQQPPHSTSFLPCTAVCTRLFTTIKIRLSVQC